MAVVKMKPTSPGQRAVVKVTRDHLYKGEAYAPLLEPQFQKAGRNNNGHITTRHKGGGHKHHYRVVDFKRNKDATCKHGGITVSALNGATSACRRTATAC